MSKVSGAYAANISSDECTISLTAIDGKKATSERSSAPGKRGSKFCDNNDDVITLVKGLEKKHFAEKGQSKRVGFISLFRFADILDVFLMALGTLLAMAVGIAMPLTVYYYGQLISQFVAHSQVKRLNQSLVTEIRSANDSDSICYQQILIRPRERLESLIGNASDRTSLLNAVFVPEVVGFVSITGGVIIFGYFAMFMWMLTTERQVRRIRLAFFRAVMRQDIDWFDVNDLQALNTHMLSDMEKLRQGLGDKITTFVRWMTTFFGSFILCVVQSWKLALLVMATMPLLVIAVAVMGRVLRIFVRKELNAYAHAGAVAKEMLAAIRTVAVFGGESKAIEKYQSRLGCAKKASIQKGVITGITQAIIWLYRFGSVALIFWYGGKLIRDECLEAGVVLGVFFIIITGITSLSNAVPLLEDFASARLAATSIFRIIDTDSSNKSQSENGIKHAIVGDIEFDNVFFSYLGRNDGCQVIHGLNLKIGAGQTVALVGPTGCGKSTILHLLQRLYEPQSGTVLIDGIDIRQLSARHLRGQIGFVDKEPVIFNTTIEENIRLGGVNVSDADVERAVREANCMDFIHQLPKMLRTHVGDEGIHLSDSEKKRIAIARALVSNPKILLLDAVTSALDPESQTVVQAVLDKVSEGRTVITVPHRLSIAQRADVIFGIHGGSVVEKGTHDELMSSQGLYYSMRCQKQDEPMQSEAFFSSNAALTRNESVAEMETRCSSDNGDLASHSSLSERTATGELSHYDAALGSLRSLRSIIPEPVFEGELNIDGEQKEEDGKFQHDKATASSMPPAQISLRRILKMNQPEALFLAVGSVASLVLGAAQPLFAVALSGDFRSFAIMFRPLERERLIGFWSGMMMVIGVGAAVAAAAQHVAFAISGERLTERLRRKCFQAMIKQDIAWFDQEKNSVGALTTLLSTDASAVKAAVGARIGMVAQTVACILTALIVAYTAEWRLSVVATAIFPITVAGALLPGRVLRSHAAARTAAIEEGNKIYKEVIMNIKTVIRLGKESHFMDKFEARFNELHRHGITNASVYSIVFSLSQCIFTGCFAVCYSFGAFLVGAHGVPPYIILRVFGSLVVGGITVSQIIANSPDVAKAKTAASKILSLLERKSEIDPLGTSGLHLDSCTGSVSFSNITFRFPRSTGEILQDFSLNLSPDESLALVDLSKYDKSAVIALMERFYDPCEGRATLDGYNLQDINIQCLRRNVGVVSHEVNFFSESVAENIAYGDNERQVPMTDIVSAARLANIHDFICSLPQGYATKLGDNGLELSDGHKLCLALARVLVRKPKVLLIDDLKMEYDTEMELVQQALKSVQDGRTCVITTKHVSTIKRAQNIGVIFNGRISEIGTHDELMALGKLYFNFITVKES